MDVTVKILQDENKTLRGGLVAAKTIIAVLVGKYGHHGLLRIDVAAINSIQDTDMLNIVDDEINKEYIITYVTSKQN